MADELPPPDEGGSSFAGRRIGGFTVGTWALILAGGIGLAVVVRRSGLFDSSAPAPIDDPTAGSGLADGTVPGGYTAAGALAGSGGASGSPGTDARQVTDNQSWRRLVTDALIGEGMPPAIVDQALGNYLSGYGLTVQEKAIVAMALRRGGTPPEGAPPITDAPVQTPSGGPGIGTPTPPADNGTAPPANNGSATPQATPEQIARLRAGYDEVVARLNSNNPGDIGVLADQAKWFGITTGRDGPIRNEQNAYFLALRYKQLGRNDLITPRQ